MNKEKIKEELKEKSKLDIFYTINNVIVDQFMGYLYKIVTDSFIDSKIGMMNNSYILTILMDQLGEGIDEFK